MKKAAFTSCLVFSLIGFFFLLTSPSYAQTLNLSHPIEHDGLTFSEPLTFSESVLPPITLSFVPHTTLLLKESADRSVLAETIVSPVPTLTKEPSPTKPFTTLSPAPPSPSPTPTQLPSPTPTKVLVTQPEEKAVTSLSTPGGLNADKLFEMSNSYRAERGLPPFQKDEKSCQLAASRAPEVAGEVASGELHKGLKERNLPYWNTENIISMRTEEEAFTWWINDYIHKKAIEGNFTYSCVACSGNSCAQEFTNYQPK